MSLSEEGDDEEIVVLRDEDPSLSSPAVSIGRLTVVSKQISFQCHFRYIFQCRNV